jgi:hypothetical protein
MVVGDAEHHLPPVTLRFHGALGEPLIVVEAAILTPDATIEYAKAIFGAAAAACRESRTADVAGHA